MNINVQNPKREARLNVYSCLFNKLQFNKMILGLQKKSLPDSRLANFHYEKYQTFLTIIS